MDSDEFLRTALDPDRLAVLGLLAIRPHRTDELAAVTGLLRRHVLGIVGPLVAGGLVSEQDGSYVLVRAELRAIAELLPAAPAPDRRVLYGMTADEQTVLRRFFRGSRLIEIPSARAKRRIVLERLALEFEPGVHYPQAEVDDILTAFHDDYAALRRSLVDEGLLSRAKGEYWRSGGRVG